MLREEIEDEGMQAWAKARFHNSSLTSSLTIVHAAPVLLKYSQAGHMARGHPPLVIFLLCGCTRDNDWHLQLLRCCHSLRARAPRDSCAPCTPTPFFSFYSAWR